MANRPLVARTTRSRLVWPGVEPATNDLLGHAVGVHIGRVDQVAAGLYEPVELVVGGDFVGLGSEGHGSQRQRRDTGAARAQRAVFHNEIPFFRDWASECDLRKCETTVNARPQLKTEIDGENIYFTPVKSSHETGQDDVGIRRIRPGSREGTRRPGPPLTRAATVPLLPSVDTEYNGAGLQPHVPMV